MAKKKPDKKTEKKKETAIDVKALRNAAMADFQAGRVQEAIQKQVAVINNASGEKHALDFQLLCQSLFSTGRFDEAIKVLERAREIFPDHLETLKNLAVCKARAEKFEEAIPLFLEALEQEADDYNLMDGLASSYFRMGNQEESVKFGNKSLKIKDDLIAKKKPLVKITKKTPLPKWDPKAREHNVVAFSVWGRKDKYLNTAIENARLMNHIYPEWTARFYIDKSVPDYVIAQIKGQGAEVVLMPDQEDLFEGLFWRFYVANDPKVQRFLVRDCDSLINVRERAAVMEWVESDKHFHMMRDINTHTEVILAGMWGGVGGVLPDLKKLGKAYHGNKLKTMTCDQIFLREQVWPIIRQSVLLHDDIFSALGAVPYPKGANIAEGRHVGGHSFTNLPKKWPGHFVISNKNLATKELPERKQFIFPISAGRTGVNWLANVLRLNLKMADVFDKRGTFTSYGFTEPEASHFMRFNIVGNTAHLRSLWRDKIASFFHGSNPIYAEMSHYLAKAGLIENIATLTTREKRVDIINLKRDRKAILHDMLKAGDMRSKGSIWMFNLDHRYPRRLVDPQPYMGRGQIGLCLWYILEMEARQAYYRILYTQVEGMNFHDVDIEELYDKRGIAALIKALGQTVSTQKVNLPEKPDDREVALPKQIEETFITMMSENPFDAEKAAHTALKRGFRLGDPL